MTGRDDLLQKNENRQSRDPNYIHYAANKEQGHKRPAAADTKNSGPKAEDKRTLCVVAEAVLQNKAKG